MPVTPSTAVAVAASGLLALGLMCPGQSQGQNRPRAPKALTPDVTDAGVNRESAAIRFGLAKPLPKSKDAIRLATYNTLNLFDHVDDPALQGEYDDLKMATPLERCQSLAQTIRALDADIIGLQEVESLEALQWFRDTFLKDSGYKYMASIDVGYYRGVECSVLSRFEITSAKVWLNESLDNVKREGDGWAAAPTGPLKASTFQRSPLMVNIKTSKEYELTVFCLHHKAGRDFNYQREAEAIRVAEFLDDIRRADPRRNIVVMGDFNAAPSDKSVRVYLRAGMIDVLAHRFWQGDGPEVAQYKTHESDRVLDYILLNSAAHRELVIGSPFVLGTIARQPGQDYTSTPEPPGYASDHYPVVIDLEPRDRP
jgi:endonuclease/exonuclease/phosphatase family metal-dependent hydrolase